MADTPTTRPTRRPVPAVTVVVFRNNVLLPVLVSVKLFRSSEVAP